MPATRTSRSTDTRSQTSGAVKPPNDWPTTTRSVRSPTASSTVCAYSESPAESSSHGRSGATTSWPRSRSAASTRCQYQPTSPAPWIKTYVAIVSLSSRTGSPHGSPAIWGASSAHGERLVKAEEVPRIVPGLDIKQAVPVLPVVGSGPIIEIRVGEVREHPPGAPRMDRPPGSSDPVVGCLLLASRCAGLDFGGVFEPIEVPSMDEGGGVCAHAVVPTAPRREVQLPRLSADSAL